MYLITLSVILWVCVCMWVLWLKFRHIFVIFITIGTRHSDILNRMFVRLLDSARLNRGLTDKIAEDLSQSSKGQQKERNGTLLAMCFTLVKLNSSMCDSRKRKLSCYEIYARELYLKVQSKKFKQLVTNFIIFLNQSL